MFGEMAQILSIARTATIKAITECKITVYTGDLQQRVVDQLPPVARKIMVALTKRLHHQTTFHAHDLVRTENLEKMVQQLRKQVVDLTNQLEEFKTAQTTQADANHKSGGRLRRHR